MCHVQNQGNIKYVHFKNVFVCMCAMDIFHFGLMCSVIMEHIRPGNHNSCFSVSDDCEPGGWRTEVGFEQ